MKTRKGELSVAVEDLTLLSKSLRPFPEKWRGIEDAELRYRRRYLDFATSPDSREVIRQKSLVLKALRQTLSGRGFVEVETPVLQVTPGGALARPFVTHHRALGIELYLRIAPELYLKRLLVGGLERVYEIGRNFRNEGIDRQHNPEFTMLEAYQAYGDYRDMMKLAERLVKDAARAVKGSLKFKYQGQDLNLEGPWKRVPLIDCVWTEIGARLGGEIDRATLALTSAPWRASPDEHGQAMRLLAPRLDVHLHPAWTPGKVILELFEKLVERKLFDPTFVIDFPREVSPLARPHRSKPGLTEQFDLIIAGMEIGPAYSELNDPGEQEKSFMGQQLSRAEWLDEEAHPFDEEFILALQYGMPPAGGLGLGVDRLTMILADVSSIRDVILFPHLRPESGR